jgi:SAM-dependent methyltransferase
MKRVPEPELMTDPAQAQAYAEADFEAPHTQLMAELAERLPGLPQEGRALDLGCGPADIAIRFARANAGWLVDGLDGSSAMLEPGRARIAREGLGERVRLYERLLPTDRLPTSEGYDLVISNSLLHHLSDPAALWESARRAVHSARPCALFAMDLARPESAADVDGLVALHAAGEPEILRRDFRNSLFAAYRVEEVREQLAAAGLGKIAVERVSDRHWVAWGVLEPSG